MGPIDPVDPPARHEEDLNEAADISPVLDDGARPGLREDADDERSVNRC
jgi:hypothetical protein